MLAACAVGALNAAPAFAQDTADEASSSGNDIIVTARRVEERLQDVPISITVLSSEALSNNNITSAKDLTTFTPGLIAQGRYGNDNVAFSIRGFSQEQRTTATVGTYFADVVMPRGSGASQGGDGAGPGQLFDLENVQVLKGPQGTLQGRNSTGGAVLLVPKRPTDRFEGYVEGSIGDFGMRRVQAVVNVPVMDSLRVRVGVDRNKRDGYLNNVGSLGTGKYGKGMGSTDYWAARFSAVADLSPSVENSLIVTYLNSESSPSIPKVIRAYQSGVAGTACSPAAATPSFACLQFGREAGKGKWAVSNSMADTASLNETWQVINTTKWQVSDNFVVKNIFSYAELRTTNNMDLFGSYWIVGGATPGTETASQVQTFAFTHDEATSGHTNAESTMVEELQFQGNSADGSFVWQGGLYYEASDPLGRSGVQTSILTPCADINTFNCLNRGGAGVAAGTGSLSLAQTKFRGKAVYGQASYELTEQLKLTAGARYTWDSMATKLNNITWIRPGGNVLSFVCSNATAPGYGTPFTYDQRLSSCGQRLSNKTKAPTWVLGLDYKPMDDALLYAKWSRGYRQGGLTVFGADPIQPYGKEKVDTYEVGAKLSWRGAMPGNFNISAYYNDFTDQQLQAGVSCDPNITPFPAASSCPGPTTAIINAGSSTLKGLEAEFGISPFDGFRINAAYAYLTTKIKEIPTAADILAGLPAGTRFNSFTLPLAGDPLNFAMKHKANVSLSYRLPLPESIGQITLGGTYVYQSKYRAVSDGCRPLRNCATVGVGNGVIPSSELINLNVSWQDVAQLPIDAAFFVTNVTNEVIYTHINDQLSRNFVSAMLAEPRMYGFRLKYKFGGN